MHPKTQQYLKTTSNFRASVCLAPPLTWQSHHFEFLHQWLHPSSHHRFDHWTAKRSRPQWHWWSHGETVAVSVRNQLFWYPDIHFGKAVGFNILTFQITSHVDLQLLSYANKKRWALCTDGSNRTITCRSGPFSSGRTLVYLSHQHVQMIPNVLVPRHSRATDVWNLHHFSSWQRWTWDSNRIQSSQKGTLAHYLHYLSNDPDFACVTL